MTDRDPRGELLDIARTLAGDGTPENARRSPSVPASAITWTIDMRVAAVVPGSAVVCYTEAQMDAFVAGRGSGTHALAIPAPRAASDPPRTWRRVNSCCLVIAPPRAGAHGQPGLRHAGTRDRARVRG